MFATMASATDNIDNIEKLYDTARQRWQPVDWPLGLYKQHLGSPLPKHSIDMYLGGAAGHRLDRAWQCLETQFAPRVKAMLNKKPRADMSADELWSETTFKMLKEDSASPALADSRQPAMIIRYRGVASLLSYLITSAIRVAISRNRRRKETVMSFDSGDDETTATEHLATDDQRPDSVAADSEQADNFAHQLRRALDSLPAEDQFILTAVFRDAIQQKQVAKILGVKDYYITRRIQAATSAIRNQMADMQQSPWNDQLDSAWSNIWEKFSSDTKQSPNYRIAAQKPSANASEISGHRLENK